MEKVGKCQGPVVERISLATGGEKSLVMSRLCNHGVQNISHPLISHLENYSNRLDEFMTR